MSKASEDEEIDLVAILETEQHFSKILADNVRHFRRLREMSQQKLADKVGVSRLWISRIENYRYHEMKTTNKVLFGIAYVLNVHPATLLKKSASK